MAQPLSIFKNTKRVAFTLEDNTVLTIERGPMVEEYANPNYRYNFASKDIRDRDWWIYKVTFEPFDPARPKHPFPFVMIAPTSDPIQAYQFYVLHGNSLLSKTDPTCSKHHTFCPITRRPPKLFPSDQVGKSTGGKVEPRTLMNMPPTATTFENRPPPKKEEGSSLKRKGDTQDQDTDNGQSFLDFCKRKDGSPDVKKGLFGHSESSTFTLY